MFKLQWKHKVSTFWNDFISEPKYRDPVTADEANRLLAGCMYEWTGFDFRAVKVST